MKIVNKSGKNYGRTEMRRIFDKIRHFIWFTNGDETKFNFALYYNNGQSFDNYEVSGHFTKKGNFVIDSIFA